MILLGDERAALVTFGAQTSLRRQRNEADRSIGNTVSQLRDTDTDTEWAAYCLLTLLTRAPASY